MEGLTIGSLIDKRDYRLPRPGRAFPTSCRTAVSFRRCVRLLCYHFILIIPRRKSLSRLRCVHISETIHGFFDLRSKSLIVFFSQQGVLFNHEVASRIAKGAAYLRSRYCRLLTSRQFFRTDLRFSSHSVSPLFSWTDSA